MDSQKLAALAIVMIAMAGYGLTIVASGALQAWWGIESSGSMIETVDLGCYWNNYCTNTATAIDWGSLSPGDSISRVIYIQNEGTAAVTLSMVTENWDPTSAANY